MSGWWAVSYAVLWVVVIALSVLVVALARQIGTLHLRLGPRGALEIDAEGPPLGEAPEPVDLADTAGRRLAVGGPGDPQFLLFVSPSCPICREVLPSLGVAASLGDMRPVVISDDQRMHPEIPPGVPAVASPELAQAYRVPGTPYAVLLDGVGIVRAKGIVNTIEQMEGLVDTARRRLEASALGEETH
jgi:methylamine dehydrogenase accessory protein MauD